VNPGPAWNVHRMMRRNSLLVGLCVCLGAPAAASEAALEPCARAALSAVQRRYESLRDLQAEFVQETRSVTLGSASGATSSARGTVTFAKPGKMRWSYEKPEPSLVVSDGRTLWLYDPGRAEAQRLPVTGEFLSGAAIQFLLGDGDLLAAFEVTSAACGDEGVSLDLVPREPTTYEKLRILADPASGDILETEMADLLGNVTRVGFSRIQANRDPGDATFRFDPPEGVDVIDIEAPPAQRP